VCDSLTKLRTLPESQRICVPSLLPIRKVVLKSISSVQKYCTYMSLVISGVNVTTNILTAVYTFINCRLKLARTNFKAAEQYFNIMHYFY